MYLEYSRAEAVGFFGVSPQYDGGSVTSVDEKTLARGQGSNMHMMQVQTDEVELASDKS